MYCCLLHLYLTLILSEILTWRRRLHQIVSLSACWADAYFAHEAVAGCLYVSWYLDLAGFYAQSLGHHLAGTPAPTVIWIQIQSLTPILILALTLTRTLTLTLTLSLSKKQSSRPCARHFLRQS